MGIFMYYAVPAIVGALISIFMDKIAVHYIKVVLHSERMLESLENMVNTLNTVSQNSLHFREKRGGSLSDGWNERLQELVGEASRMVGEHRLVGEQRGFSRVHYKLNILSRYRRSEEIAKLISDMSKHLKLVPVVQLECVLWLIVEKRRLGVSFLLSCAPTSNDFTGGIVGWVITEAFRLIFLYMGRLRNFKKKLASFRELMDKINYFVSYSQQMIRQIQSMDANQSDNWLNNARNWLAEMNVITAEGSKINDMGSPIACCKKSEQITELTSRIDAHLNNLSCIALDLLFHEIKVPTGRPLTSHEIMPATLSTSSEETLTPRRLSTASQETECSKSDGGSSLSQETECSKSDAGSSYETEGSTSHPTAPQETEGSTSHPTPPLPVGALQGVHPPRGEQSSFYPPQANVEPQGHTVRIHCEANPEFFLAARGDIAVLALENPHDPHQQWIKVDSWGLRVKDEAGFPAFALVNKATRHVLKHGDKEWDQIYLADYNHDMAEQSVLWTLSADVGNGYQSLRPVNNINLNMDAKAADGHVGGIRDGNELILFEWKEQSNQKWKLQPIH